MTAVPDYFAGWVTTVYNGNTVWVESYEAASHFQTKASLLNDLRALRELTSIGTEHGASSDSMHYLSNRMDAVRKKLISNDRKSRREGWWMMEDERMQGYLREYRAGMQDAGVAA